MEPPIPQILLALGAWLVLGSSALATAIKSLDAGLFPWSESLQARDPSLDSHWLAERSRDSQATLDLFLNWLSFLGWASVAVAASTFHLMEGVGGIGLQIALSMGLLWLGDVTLLRSFVGRAPERGLYLGGALRPLFWMFWPFCRGLVSLQQLRFGDAGSETDPRLSLDEVEFVIAQGLREGLLDKDQEKLLASVFDYGDTLARAIMIPRTDVVGLAVDSDLQTVLGTIEREGYSRYPVYVESVDEIVGLFMVKDMLPYLKGPRKEPFNLRKFLRKPYYVPETKKISELMRELQVQKIHLALIADEFGGTAGLVTQEDIIEEIFGEIYDETDAEETPAIQALSANRFLVDARISLRDYEEYFGVEFDGEKDYDTLAGFVVAQVGRVLAQGETFTWGAMQLVVREADATHIRTVEIHRTPNDEPLEGAGNTPNSQAEDSLS